MANGMPQARPIRSASDEAATKPETKPETTVDRTIRSASDEGTPKASRHALTQPQAPAPRSTDGQASQGGRAFAGGSADRPSRSYEPAGAANGRSTPVNQRVAGEVGGILASNYGAACSELMSQMQGAARRQGEFMNDMLQARSPVDVMAAGNRYLVGGLQAFFDGSVRIALAASHRAEESHQRRDRHAA